jgi:hypothetical protein
MNDLIAKEQKAARTAWRFLRLFPLPWSHHVRLLQVQGPLARRFYEAEALRGGW